MWITPDGRTHMNAHASPAMAMSDRMVDSVVSIARDEGTSASDRMWDGFFETMEECADESFDASVLSPDLVGEWIPDEYLDGEFTTSADLADYLRSVSIDWRMDAYSAVGDLIDDVIESDRKWWRRLVDRVLRR